ncbi:MAG TPA: transketolase C-terminal domain-containing protein [Casimicrobiaceae bacterium]|nr:transketolase C-terminal domain-containing protein [Casimicrobiaceae bacterium]
MSARDGPAAGERMLLTGNHAVAWAARLARPKVVPVYPITPQTPILEKITEFQADGAFDAEVITPESEHSVMAACIPASLAGVRVFTATASQGLLLMHELLHYASGARAPIVMANVNRTLASPWAFWPDETDSLAQRDTGWIQYYAESAQESLDTVIQAFRVAEALLLPTMVNLDAFYVSHALEPVRMPAQETVDAFLPPYAPEHRLDTGKVESWGNVVTQDMFYRHRRALDEAMAQVPAAALATDQAWRAATGRGYGVVERYRCESARLAIVTMGSMCGTVRDAVDVLREEGLPVGLVKVRLFRPFPAQALRAALAGVSDALVLDRNYSPGCGGVLHQELRAALYGMAQPPRIHGYLAGVGGVNVSPGKVVAWARAACEGEAALESVWAR